MTEKFIVFCKTNKILLLFAAFWAFIAFSAKIFLFTIGLDTEGFIADKQGSVTHWLGINRAALVVLKNLWHIEFFNPFYSTVIAMILLVFSAISWSFLIFYFDKNNYKKLPILAFISVVATSPIWAENLQFALQSAEVFFGIFLTPLVTIMLFDGFIKKWKKKIILSIFLMAFIIGIYQSFAILFIFSIAVGFVFINENNNFDAKLLVKILFAFLISMTIYLLVSNLSILIFDIDKPDYLSKMNLYNTHSIKTIFLNILGFAYILTFAKIPQIHSIVSSLFLDNQSFTLSTGMSVSERIFELSSVFGSITLLPLIFVFWTILLKNMKKNALSKNMISLSAGLLIPLSVMLLAIMLGNKPPIRSLFVLPFVFGFLFYFVISRSSKKTAYFFAILSFIVAINSSQISSILFYNDSERFRQDINLANSIDFEIKKIQDTSISVAALVLIGKNNLQKNANYIRSEIIGFSEFEFGANGYFESSKRGVLFMKSLGMNYEHPDSSQMKKAREIQKEMPNFPKNGSVKDCEDFIIVKLSESSFVE